VARRQDHLEPDVPDRQIPFCKKEIRLRKRHVTCGVLVEELVFPLIHGKESRRREFPDRLQMIRMGMGDQNGVDPLTGNPRFLQSPVHVGQQVPVARIHKDSFLPLDQIGVAVVFRVALPQEGVDAVGYFHDRSSVHSSAAL
jgi:hypothetical protein